MKTYKVNIGGGHIFIEAADSEKARQKAIEIVFEIEMPKNVLWETQKERMYYNNTSAFEIKFNKWFRR